MTPTLYMLTPFELTHSKEPFCRSTLSDYLPKRLEELPVSTLLPILLKLWHRRLINSICSYILDAIFVNSEYLNIYIGTDHLKRTCSILAGESICRTEIRVCE